MQVATHYLLLQIKSSFVAIDHGPDTFADGSLCLITTWLSPHTDHLITAQTPLLVAAYVQAYYMALPHTDHLITTQTPLLVAAYV